MAKRFDVPSLQDDVETKRNLKQSPEMEKIAKDWIEVGIFAVITSFSATEFFPALFQAVIGTPCLSDATSVAVGLKSGVVLCRLMDCIQPGLIRRIHTGNIQFAQMVRYCIGCLFVCSVPRGIVVMLLMVVVLFSDRKMLRVS